MSLKRGYLVCAVKSCKNNTKNCKFSFFRFPKNVDRAKEWATACLRSDLLPIANTLYASGRICGNHFEDKMFLNDLKNRLQQHAIPKLNLQDQGEVKFQNMENQSIDISMIEADHSRSSEISMDQHCSVLNTGTDQSESFQKMPCCCVTNCPSRSGSIDCGGQQKYFCFPKDPQLRKKWMIACGKSEESFKADHGRVCQKHFNDECFEQKMTQSKMCSGKSSLKLIPGSIPTKYLLLKKPHKQKPSERIPLYAYNGLVSALRNNSNSGDSSVANSATIDHDYIATTESEELQVPGRKHFWRDNQEDLITHQHTLENLKRELCRLCGQKGSDMMHIFEPASDLSEDMPVLSKINMYLPIKINSEDSLPLCICSNCLSILNQWHDLYMSCIAADTILSKTFGKNIQRITVGDPCVSEVQRNAETQTEHIHSDPLPEAMREIEDICTCCEEHKTRSTHTTDKLFEEEFDKCFATYRDISNKCCFCQELFKNAADRKKHITMCYQLSTICELCGEKVPCRKDLKRHKFFKHRGILLKYSCHKCDRSFKTATGLNNHLESIHGAKGYSGKYCCTLCGSVFRREIYFRIHKRKHEKGLIKTVFQIEDFRQEVSSDGYESLVVYACPVCQEKFNDMLSLAVHVTEKKRLKCSSCHKIMSCEKRFFLHVCGQWTCQYCLKSFDQRVKWLVHERLHTGEKPLKCRRCDLTFRTWHGRRHHEKNHKPF